MAWTLNAAGGAEEAGLGKGKAVNLKSAPRDTWGFVFAASSLWLAVSALGLGGNLRLDVYISAQPHQQFSATSAGSSSSNEELNIWLKITGPQQVCTNIQLQGRKGGAKDGQPSGEGGGGSHAPPGKGHSPALSSKGRI